MVQQPTTTDSTAENMLSSPHILKQKPESLLTLITVEAVRISSKSGSDVDDGY